ncbi:hypothetical protein FGG08_006071 [Glutinoglossum americanum]|uniref:Cytochrome P450 n=1 Tax=Glutinoglossum americanum TaxID=1670608 RepID=A0A9P8I207_9PEZI|nr:hypothetical protein FGG08_006071 [Glutinoglossum americanum]
MLFLEPDWAWHLGHKPFRNLNTDFFLTVSPGGLLAFTCDADVISQIVSRRNDFPKPLEMYGMLNIFGRNVVTTEGPLWRQHRKITSPLFTEKNYALVWVESLSQAQAMLHSWVGKDGKGNRTMKDLAGDTMRLPLHVISRAGFGVKLLWPGQEGEDLATENNVGSVAQGVGMSSAEIPEGHTMSYRDALGTLLRHILWVLLMPRWLLRNSPLKVHKKSYVAYTEWGEYMRQLFEKKKAEILAEESREGLDLMGSLVKGAGIVADAPGGDTEKRDSGPTKQLLTDEEIMGNAFVFILAGHETAATTLHYSILSLALNSSAQRHLQQDLNHHFGDRPISNWNYETDVPALFGSMPGAVMNETLRCFPPVISIPKRTPKGHPQTLIFQNRKVTIPGGCKVSLVVVGTHQNPKYWPGDDLRKFRPERWLVDPTSVNTANDSAGGEGAATSLFRPPRGAYIPFSEGYRACLGRRFAQVEILAVLAVLFREYSVELAVDEWATDEEVDKMPVGGDERRAVWEKAAERARWLVSGGSSSVITLGVRAGKVPVRWTRRGEERFVFDA